MICLVIGIFIISCQKQHLPAPTNASPVFYFNGLVGGTYTSFRAGVSNYYMYSSYTQDSNGVYNYTGNLKEFNCGGSCPPSIKFIINNYESLPAGASESYINKALDTGYFNYLIPGGTPGSYSITFYPTSGTFASVKNYTWDFGDGTLSNFTSSLDSISHLYTHKGTYNTSLFVTFSDTSTSKLSNTVQAGNLNSIFYCSISYLDSTTTTSFSSIISGGKFPYTYQWSFGDGFTSTAKNPSHSYVDSTINAVSLTITDSAGHKASANAYAAAGNASNTQLHLMSYYTLSPVPVSNPLGLSNITVIYTDASGNIFSSNNALQPDSSFFRITSVANYQNNENGQTTKQLHVKFDCILYDSSGKTLVIKNGDAVIAVAYK